MASEASSVLEDKGRGWLILGFILLMMLTTVMAAISPLLVKHELTKSSPIIVFTALYMAAGVVWFVLMRMLYGRGWMGVSLMAIILTGLLMRAVFFASPVALEDDHHRYLWDGAVVVHNESPYWLSPADARSGLVRGPIGELSQKPEAQRTLQYVNHPQLKTIYPPVAQAAFAIAAFIDPFSYISWRVVIFASEIIVLVCLLLILKQVHLPLAMVAIYWMNPLVVREFYNAVHMDVLLLACLAPAILYALRRRKMMATFFILLAAGVKVWPVLLLPVLWREELRLDMKALAKLAGAVVFSLVILALMFYPIYSEQLGESSGFVAFSKGWQNNDGLFKLFVGASWLFHEALGLEDWYVSQRARYIMMAVFFALYIFLLRKPEKTVGEIIVRMGMVVIIFFMLSATQMPWYFTWLLPFMVIKPIWAILAYSFLLPLYLLQFKFELYGQWELFQSVVPWFEHIPVIIALIIERRRLGCFTCFDACPLPTRKALS